MKPTRKEVEPTRGGGTTTSHGFGKKPDLLVYQRVGSVKARLVVGLGLSHSVKGAGATVERVRHNPRKKHWGGGGGERGNNPVKRPIEENRRDNQPTIAGKDQYAGGGHRELGLTKRRFKKSEKQMGIDSEEITPNTNQPKGMARR